MKPLDITIRFSDQKDARNVLGYLNEMISRYGEVSAADLWGAMELYKFGSKDKNIGWQSLEEAAIVVSKGNYYLHLPMPNYILEE